MKLTKEQETRLTELAYAEKSNKEIAQELGIGLTDVHAARSRLGITIPKVKAALEDGAKPSVAKSRSKEEIQQEYQKVQKARLQAYKKIERCNDRLNQLFNELEAI